MSVRAHAVQYSYAEYLAFEAASNSKHEYLGGQIYGMAGGSPQHAALGATISGLLFAQLRGGRCRVLDADLRVRVPTTGLATYPDVSVVCGPWDRSSDDEHAVTNPIVIVEILSPSSEAYDRGEKFDHYRQLPSLRHYLRVAQRERSIEIRSRDADGVWTTQVHTDGDEVDLSAIAARLDVRAVYDDAAEPR